MPGANLISDSDFIEIRFMFIVLEGLDGAGKSTQVSLIKEYIRSKGLEIKYLHFPRFDAPVYGEMIAKFLRGDYGPLDAVHPQLVALLFAEDRRTAASLIREWLKQGCCVLLDRYVYSNVAFQCAKLEHAEQSARLRDWILDTEYVRFDIPRPDLNIFIDVPLDFVGKKLKEMRRGEDREYLNGKEDIHEADLGFQRKVRELYLELTVLDKDFIRVDCAAEDGSMLCPQDIFARIAARLPM